MDHRIGTCSACGARYKIPASFPHARAKCRTCGGAVEIGPVIGEGAPPRPEPPPERSPGESGERPPERSREAPSGSRGPAEDREPRAEPALAARPAPTLPPGEVAAEPEAARAASAEASTASPAPAAPDSARTAREPDRARPAAPARAPAAGRAQASRREPQAPAATERPARRAGPSVGEPAPQRPRPKAVPLTLGGLMLASALVAAYFLTRDEPADSALASPPTEAPAAQSGPAQPETEASGAETPRAEAPAASSPSEPTGARTLAREIREAASVELATLVDLVGPEQRESAEGRRLAGALARFLAAASEPERAAAAGELVAAGRPALAFAVDAWKGLDLARAEQRALAARLEREVVVPLAGGRGFGWREDDSEASLDFDRRVIAQWHAVAADMASDEAWRAFVAGESR